MKKVGIKVLKDDEWQMEGNLVLKKENSVYTNIMLENAFLQKNILLYDF